MEKIDNIQKEEIANNSKEVPSESEYETETDDEVKTVNCWLKKILTAHYNIIIILFTEIHYCTVYTTVHYLMDFRFKMQCKDFLK